MVSQDGMVVMCSCGDSIDATTIEGARSMQTVTTLQGFGVRVLDSDGNVLGESWHATHGRGWRRWQ